jgi:hypothetical protein
MGRGREIGDLRLEIWGRGGNAGGQEMERGDWMGQMGLIGLMVWERAGRLDFGVDAERLKS